MSNITFRMMSLICLVTNLCLVQARAEESAAIASTVKRPLPQVLTPSGTQAKLIKMSGEVSTVNPAKNALRTAFFGDLHVHTAYSADAYAFGTIATPYDAYRYALGDPLEHPAGFKMQLKTPLDFYAVTDHANFLNAFLDGANAKSALGQLALSHPLHNLNAAENMDESSIPSRLKIFRSYARQAMKAITDGALSQEVLEKPAKQAWHDIISAAEQFNNPGIFTTFVGYEYTTASDDSGNLHRNVIFRGADQLPVLPFSRLHSQNPEDLWSWMDSLRERGIESLAIPHNANGSNGQMFRLVDWAGNPIDDEYAAKRMRNEPLVEITQVKGTSETHPALSPDDEWADFEIMPYRVSTTRPSNPNGSYVRQALVNGLVLEDNDIRNPYRFGFIGASDTHNAATSVEEDNFVSKIALMDGQPAMRGSIPLSAQQQLLIEKAGRQMTTDKKQRAFATGGYETWGAAGLTGVWAEENTREAIYDSFRRKETFATSGPRILLRFFGSFAFEDMDMHEEKVLERSYAEGVPMGSDLISKSGHLPTFIVWATRDPNSAPLQRLQIIKGWTEDGTNHEKVFDIACSNGVSVNPQTDRCSDNGAEVNLEDCSISQNKGVSELKIAWTDAAYNPEQRAFYYARALENPTCRWSTWDAVRAGVEPRDDLQATIQERAWSSPIWIISET